MKTIPHKENSGTQGCKSLLFLKRTCFLSALQKRIKNRSRVRLSSRLQAVNWINMLNSALTQCLSPLLVTGANIVLFTMEHHSHVLDLWKATHDVQHVVEDPCGLFFQSAAGIQELPCSIGMKYTSKRSWETPQRHINFWGQRQCRVSHSFGINKKDWWLVKKVKVEAELTGPDGDVQRGKGSRSSTGAQQSDRGRGKG